jgi:hypothetical protein
MKKIALAGLSVLALTTAFAGGIKKKNAKKQKAQQEQCCEKSTCCKKAS